MPNPLVMMLSGIATCGTAIVAVACHVIGLIVLIVTDHLKTNHQ